MNVKTKHGSFASLFSAHVHALSESFAGISLLFRSKSVVHTHHASKLLNFLCFNFFSILVSFMYIAKYWRRLVCAHLWSDGNTRSIHRSLRTLLRLRCCCILRVSHRYLHVFKASGTQYVSVVCVGFI